MTNEGKTTAVAAERAGQGAPAGPKSKKRATKGKKAPTARPGAKGAKPKGARKGAEPAGPREGSKTAKVLALLSRKEGATLAHIMKATGWQAHSVRGFLSGTVGKKMGLTVASEKTESGDRVYRLG